MLKLKKISVVMSMVILSAGLSGCQTQMIKDSRASIDDDYTASIAMAKDVGVRSQSKSIISSHSSIWVPAEKIKRAEVIDPKLLKNFVINRTLLDLLDASERLTSITGIPVQIKKKSNEVETGSDDSAIDNNTSGAAALPKGSYAASYSGTLAGFLDALATKYGYYWEYSDNRIVFFTTKTQKFVLMALPGQLGGSTTVGDASSQTTLSLDGLDAWADIRSAVEAMLTEDGNVIASPATGSITVTDTPSVLAEVKIYIDEQNKHMAKQVAVNVRILNVTLNDADSYGVNWNLVNGSLKRALGLAATSGDPLVVGAAGITLSKLVNGSTDSSGGTVATDSKWQGSSLLIEALSKQGDVSVVTSATAVTLNNQQVPIHVGKTTGYLESSSSTADGAGGPPTVTLTQAELTTGFALNVLPHIQADGKLLLQYTIDLSSLLGMFTVSSGGSSIQTPDVETRRIIQRVAIDSGETLVLAGFENAEVHTDRKGTGKASNTWLGGSNSADSSKTVMIVLVTPIVDGQ